VRFGVEVGKRSKGGNHCFHKAFHKALAEGLYSKPY